MLFGTADRDLRRRALALCVGAFAAAMCRTPPPLPSSPSETNEPVAAAPGRDATSEPVEAASPIDVAAIETVREQDFSLEQRELAERYAKRHALSTLRGEASYYGKAFAGRKTASGEVFEPRRFTAAHRSLPFGTVLRVKRVGTPSVVYVRVNDRGPFGKKRRILDLSEAAAGELDMLRDGVCEVRIEVLERGKP
jgi:peptidoglycan lytic transglycosylase